MNLSKFVKSSLQTLTFATSLLFSMFAVAEPVLLFSDLTAAPNSGWSTQQANKGAVVTIWGYDFGSDRGSNFVTVNGTNLTANSDYVDEWGKRNNPVPFLDSVTFQLNDSIPAGAGTITVTVNGQQSNSIPFRIGEGNIFFADVNHNTSGSGSLSDPWSNPDSFLDVMRPGDILYFREGLYNQRYNGGKSNIWIRDREVSGTAAQPIAFVGYPGEVAMFDSFTTGDENFNKGFDLDSPHFTVAKIHAVAWGPAVEIGAPFVRVVGNDLEGTKVFLRGTGTIIGGRDGMQYYGNSVHGSRSGNRLDHGIYLNGCATEVGGDVAYNYVFDNSFGRGPHIVANSQGTRCESNEFLASHRIHHNVVDCGDTPSRAIGIFDLSWDSGEAQQPQPAYVYNNIINRCGDEGHAAMYHNNGHAHFYNNTMFDLQGAGFSVEGSLVLSTTVANNMFHMSPGAGHDCVRGTPDLLDSNAYFGGCDVPSSDSNAVEADPEFSLDLVAGLFQISESSPLIGEGSRVAEVSNFVRDDFFNNLRSTSIDIGAIQFNAGTEAPLLPPPNPNPPSNFRVQLSN